MDIHVQSVRPHPTNLGYETDQFWADDGSGTLVMVTDASGISGSQIRIVPVGPAVQMNDPARQGNRVEVLVIKR